MLKREGKGFLMAGVLDASVVREDGWVGGGFSGDPRYCKGVGGYLLDGTRYCEGGWLVVCLGVLAVVREGGWVGVVLDGLSCCKGGGRAFCGWGLS